MVMCSEPVMRTPASGLASAYFLRIDIRPGISYSAMEISLRPQSASERSATLNSAAIWLIVAVPIFCVSPITLVSINLDTLILHSVFAMASILKSLRLAADPNRLRVLLLLEQEELSVAELQEILSKGQSQISTHLSQLKQAGLVDDRRMGKNAFYRLTASAELMELFRQAAVEIPEAAQDQEALRLALRKRRDNMRRYFDELAGKFGRQYVPGRSWKGIAEALLKLMPPMVIADLGAGEGTISQLMAQRAKKVIAIDNSEKMVEFGVELARKHGIANLEYRLGDLEDVPIRSGTVDLAFLSQALHHAVHPERAIGEAWRILEARRAHRDSRFEPASLRRGTRDVRRSVARLHGVGDRTLPEGGGFQERGDRRGVPRAGSSLFRNDAGDGGEVGGRCGEPSRRGTSRRFG